MNTCLVHVTLNIKSGSMELAEENDLAHKIIGLSIDIHKVLGPGLDIHIYRECLSNELKELGIDHTSDFYTPLIYKNMEFPHALRSDFLVADSVVVILDPSDTTPDYRVSHMLRILRDNQLKLGLIINFNSHLLKKGIRRITNHKLVDEAGHSLLTEADDPFQV